MRVFVIVICTLAISATLYFLITSLFSDNTSGSSSKDDLEIIIKYVIPEAKDLCKTFLTLSTAVLVASITFSDRIIQFQNADNYQKNLIISSWMLILMSIILCGAGLSVLMFSEACVVFESCDYMGPLERGAILLLTTGVVFTFGLLFFILAAIFSHKLKNA